MEINWIAILIATLSTFVLGFVWYNPNTFGNAWQKAAGISDEQMKDTSGMAKIFIMSFIFSFIMALFVSYFNAAASALGGGDPSLIDGARHGLYLGLGISTMSIGVNAMYERKSFAYILINGGYQTLSIVIISVILTGWG